MPGKNPEVDAFIERQTRWQAETKQLRSVLLGCGLHEALKWGKPCYTHEGGNVVILQSFKGCLAAMFFRGALLDDPEGHLRAQGENSQAAMRLELRSVKEARQLSPALRGFVAQAKALQESGTKVDFKAKRELALPEELSETFAREPQLAKAFAALTPGRQRAYVLHFAGAKQSKTRHARIERCAPDILAGKGLHDR